MFHNCEKHFFLTREWKHSFAAVKGKHSLAAPAKPWVKRQNKASARAKRGRGVWESNPPGPLHLHVFRTPYCAMSLLSCQAILCHCVSVKFLQKMPPPRMTTARVVTTIDGFAHSRSQGHGYLDERSDAQSVYSVYSSDDPCGRHAGGEGGLLNNSFDRSRSARFSVRSKRRCRASARVCM